MNRRADLGAGEIVGDKYVVDRRLGEGGMGTVYLARHSVTDRKVALKWVPLDDELTRERTLVEARSMGRLSHPNVVGVLDAGQHGDAVFLVMEYLSGRTLRAHADGRGLSPSEAVDLLMPALCGVAAAHQAGVLHRDLKPDNLFVCLDHKGVAYDTKVLDFGVAKEMKDGVAVSSLTNAGMIVGTPKYMAPEQLASGPKLDARADVYALGLILYELLTGRLPYDTGDIRAMAVTILRGALIPLEVLRPDLPPGLCAIVAKTLATERNDRYVSVTAFARALESFAGVKRFEAPRKMRATMDGEIPEAITAPEFGLGSARTRRDPMPVQPSVTTPMRQGKRGTHDEAQGPVEAEGANATRDARAEGAHDAPGGAALVAGAPVGALAAAAARAPAGVDVAARDSGGRTLRGPHELRRAAAHAARPAAAPTARDRSHPAATSPRSAAGRWIALAFAALVVLGAAWTVAELRSSTTATTQVPAAAAADVPPTAPAAVPQERAVTPPTTSPTARTPASAGPAQAVDVAPATPAHATSDAPRAAPAAEKASSATRPTRTTARAMPRTTATSSAPPGDRPAKPAPSKVQAAGGTLRSDDF